MPPQGRIVRSISSPGARHIILKSLLLSSGHSNRPTDPVSRPDPVQNCQLHSACDQEQECYHLDKTPLAHHSLYSVINLHPAEFVHLLVYLLNPVPHTLPTVLLTQVYAAIHFALTGFPDCQIDPIHNIFGIGLHQNQLVSGHNLVYCPYVCTHTD